MPNNILGGSGFNALVKARYGYMLFNKNDTYIGRAIEKYGEFSELEAALFKQVCNEGDVVLDIGANIGSHTLAFANMVGETGYVYAFEPQPVIFQTLCANVALNSLQNVATHGVALSDSAGDVLIPQIDYSRQSNFGSMEVERFEHGSKIPKQTLDDPLEFTKIKLMKIDVEGMEAKVIRGARNTIKQHQPAVYVENDRIDKSAELIELMWSLDYRIYWHTPALFNPSNYFNDPENIYPNTVSINMLCLPRSAPSQLNGFTEITDQHSHPMKKD